MPVENLVIDVRTNAGNSARQLRSLSNALRGVSNTATSVSRETGRANASLGKLFSSIKRIAFYRAIRSVIKAITEAFSEGLENAVKFSRGIAGESHRFAEALDSIATKSLVMKNQLGAAFAGLLTALTPIINALITAVTQAADAVNQFFAAFTGTRYLKAREVPQIWTKDANAAAKATKEWKNQLLGFDEINRLEEPSSGGGGGKINDVDPSLMFEDAAIDERIQRIAEKIKALAASFKITFRDVFFDWSNLTGEQIAEKFIAGLGSLVGVGVGFIIGGVPGAVIGAIIGATAGVEFASLIFDHDGVISKKEIGEMLRAALFGLAGGVIGFTVGGVRGALLGASIGVSLETILTTLTFTDAISENVLSSLSDVLGTGAGAIIGFRLGGPLGAVFGATIGLGLSIGIESFLIEDTSNWGVGDWIAHVLAALLPVAGTAIGLMLGGPVGAVLGAVVGAGLSLELKSILIEDKSNWGAGDWISHIIAPLLPVAGAAVGLAVGGPLGAVVGLALGSGLALGINAIVTKDKSGWTAMDWISNIIEPLAVVGFGAIGLAVGGPLGLAVGASLGIGLRFGLEKILMKDESGWSSNQWLSSLVGALAPIAGAAIGFMVGGPFGAAIGAVIGIGIKFVIKGIDWGDWNPTDLPNVEAATPRSVTRRADGGFVGDGQLFVARERGPELVGSIGGRTAVANNDQIIEGIRAGVFEAVSSAMSGNGGSGDVNLKVYLDSREIKAGMQRLDRAWGA